MIYSNYFFVAVVVFLSVSVNAFHSSFHKQTLISLRGGLRMNDSSSGIGWNSHKVSVFEVDVVTLPSMILHLRSCVYINRQ